VRAVVYEPGSTPVHGLDVRAKLGFQVGFAVAAFAEPTPPRLAALAVVAGVVLALAQLSPLRVLRAYWPAFLILAGSPVVNALAVGPPWVRPAEAAEPALAVSRVALVLFVGAAYVATTPVRETRGAIQRHVPGRAGQLLGVGVALTFRFIPVFRRDIRARFDASAARLGDQRSATDRAGRLAVAGLSRAFTRADRLSLALRARCFAWNPTPPALRFGRRDYSVLVAGALLALSAFV